MTDHHDFGDHHDDFGHDDDYSTPDFGHHDDPSAFDPPDHLAHLDDDWVAPDHHDVDVHHETAPEESHVVEVNVHHDVTADDPTAPDVFPPPVDVGELPEPVDGFPWTDAATLGTPDLTAHDTTLPVDPHELAEYAGTDIPPGADPWTVLADSDDPATSTLARFWSDPSQ